MRIRPLFFFAALAAGCGGGPMGGADAAVDIAMPAVDLSTESADIRVVAPTEAIVTTSSFAQGGAGALATVGLADKSVATVDKTLDRNNFVRVSQGKVLVLDRTHGTLRVYDPLASFKNPVEIAVGANPQDALLLPASSKAYVTLLDAPSATAVAVVDTAKPMMGVVKSIAIPTNAADGDGIPEAQSLWWCGQYVYVETLDLDRGKMMAPAGPGRVVAVDTATDAVDAMDGVIPLAGENPHGFAPDGAGCDVVLVADASNQAGAIVAGKGGVERVDLSLRKSRGLAVGNADLAGNPIGVAARSRNLAFALVTVDAGATQQVVAIDPMAGKVLGPVLPKAETMTFVAVSPDGQLFAGVVTPDAMTTMPRSGLWVGPADGTMLAGPPLDLGQAPFAIAFF